MPLFDKKVTKYTEKQLTKAAEIYSYFLAGMSHTEMFKKHGIPFKHSTKVYNEAKRIEKELMAYRNGQVVIKEAVYEDVIENDEIVGTTEVSPPEYYVVTTKTKLFELVASDILDVVKVGVDVIKSNPDYDKDRTFTTWKNDKGE